MGMTEVLGLTVEKQQKIAELKQKIKEKCGDPKQVRIGGTEEKPIMGYKTKVETGDLKECYCNKLKESYNTNQKELRMLEEFTTGSVTKKDLKI